MRSLVGPSQIVERDTFESIVLNIRQVRIPEGLRPARDLRHANVRIRRHTACKIRARKSVPTMNHPVDLQKRLVLGVKTVYDRRPKIEKPHLGPSNQRAPVLINA